MASPFSKEGQANLNSLAQEVEVPHCNECPAHCCRAPHRVHLHEKERLTGLYEFEFLVPDLKLLGVIVQVQGKCIYLDQNNKCGIFAVRPYFCRVYDCRNDPSMTGRIPSDWLSIYRPENPTNKD